MAGLIPLTAGRASYVPGSLSAPGQSAIQRVIAAAARKGVTLDIRRMPGFEHTAEEAAEAVGAVVGQIVRTVVFVAPGPGGRLGPIICMASGHDRIDPGLVAAVTGRVATRPATAREVGELTGYSIGGIPPFGHGWNMPVIMDQDLGRFEWVWVSAGTDSAILQVTPRTLQMLANAIVARLH